MFVVQTIPDLKVYAVASDADAAKLADSAPGLIVRGADDLKQIPQHLLVRMYNATLPSSQAPVKKFSTLAEAADRVWEVIGVLAIERAKKGRAPKAPKEKKAPAPKVTPRPSTTFGGQFLYRISKKNPRREGTHGWKSFNLVKDGMSYEDYLKAGGRRVDLAWDVAHRYLEVRAPGAKPRAKTKKKAKVAA